jgi:hypothetical protein
MELSGTRSIGIIVVKWAVHHDAIRRDRIGYAGN